MKKPLPISASGIADFNGCPKRYYETKILKKYRFEETEAIKHGNIVHEQLERYVKFKEALPEHLEFVMPMFQFLEDDGYKLYAELEMAVKRDWTPTDFWDKDGYLRGKIDLLGIKGNSAVIIDHKSGKRKNDPFQLQVYGATTMRVLGLDKVDAYYLWLKTKETDKITIDASNIDEIQTDIVSQITTIEEAYDNQEFPARTTPLCGYCPALDTCREAIYYKVQRDRKRR